MWQWRHVAGQDVLRGHGLRHRSPCHLVLPPPASPWLRRGRTHATPRLHVSRSACCPAEPAARPAAASTATRARRSSRPASTTPTGATTPLPRAKPLPRAPRAAYSSFHRNSGKPLCFVPHAMNTKSPSASWHGLPWLVFSQSRSLVP